MSQTCFILFECRCRPKRMSPPTNLFHRHISQFVRISIVIRCNYCGGSYVKCSIQFECGVWWFMLIFYYHNESDLQTVIIPAGGASQASDGGGLFTIHQNGFATRLLWSDILYSITVWLPS